MKIDDSLYKEFPLSENKFIAFQISRWENDPMFSFAFYYRNKKQDHPGFTLSINIFYYNFHVDFYDSRHSEEET